MYTQKEDPHLKKLQQSGLEKARREAEEARKRAMEDTLFDIERRRDKRESRHWIWNAINTLIAAAALAVGIIALFQ